MDEIGNNKILNLQFLSALVRYARNKISGLVIRLLYLVEYKDSFYFMHLFQLLCNEPWQRAFLQRSITSKKIPCYYKAGLLNKSIIFSCKLLQLLLRQPLYWCELSNRNLV